MPISKVRSVGMAITIGSGYVIWGILISIQPPFYPTLAEEIGAEPHQYGFVFGIMCLSALIFSPIFATFGLQFGIKRLYVCGALGQGISGVCFATLIFIKNLEWFLILSYFLRFVEGASIAAAWSAILSLLLEMFPSKVFYIMAWTETAFGIGYMVGPLVGASLYKVGGFGMPFFVVGGACIINAIFLFLIIPSPSEPKNWKETDEKDFGNKLTIHGVFSSPFIIIPMLDCCFCMFGLSFAGAMIGPYMEEELGSDKLEVSICFAISGGSYMVFSTIAALITKRLKHPMMLSLTSNVLFLVVYSFIGPVSVIPINPNINLIWALFGLNGTAYAFSMVSTFIVAQKSAVQQGYKDDISTYIVISASYTMFYYIGMFISPTLGGFLVDAFGFRETTWFLVVVYLFGTIMDIFYLTISKKSENCTPQEYIKIP